VVRLGKNGRLVRVEGVGWNYFTMGLRDLEGPRNGEVVICGLVISFNPRGVQFSFIQHIKWRFFKPFLKLMRDFVDEKVPIKVEGI
jgi:hypothetical protein